jgi:hypothetical protein
MSRHHEQVVDATFGQRRAYELDVPAMGRIERAAEHRESGAVRLLQGIQAGHDPL